MPIEECRLSSLLGWRWPARAFYAILVWCRPTLQSLRTTSTVVAWYDANAERLDAAYESLPPGVDTDLLPSAPGLVIDVGAGTGRNAAWLASLGHEFIAVEPSIALRLPGGGTGALPLTRTSSPTTRRVRHTSSGCCGRCAVTGRRRDVLPGRERPFHAA